LGRLWLNNNVCAVEKKMVWFMFCLCSIILNLSQWISKFLFLTSAVAFKLQCDPQVTKTIL
uniref:Uncharacterized protein n=1 Tax=Saimiri boliviensis boliviensis TaxID=39432 RepID=A0A2K6U8P3_SAIBB